MIKKVAILTSGGDSPGMNNAIRTIVKTACANNIKPYLIFEGYKGLHAGNIFSADKYNVDKYITKGGTFIYSSRFPEFKNIKVRLEAKKQLEKHGINSLIVIGGDGSYKGAQLLHELKVKTIALPGTIDNDISSSQFTIGYDTALNTIVNAVDKVRDTMESHQRAAIIEVMGHGCGDLALFSALATGAEGVSINEKKLTKNDIVKIIDQQINKFKKRSVIIIVSEFIYQDLHALEEYVSQKTGIATRAMSLKHIQRGGIPTARERINAAKMGMKAIELLQKDKSGLAIGIINGKVDAIPILKALSMPRENRVEIVEKVNKLNQAK